MSEYQRPREKTKKLVKKTPWALRFLRWSFRMLFFTALVVIPMGIGLATVFYNKIASELPDGSWHSVQFESSATEGIVCPFAVYGCSGIQSSWHDAQTRRVGCVWMSSPCAGAAIGPAPSGSPWHFAQPTGPLRCKFSSACWPEVSVL